MLRLSASFQQHNLVSALLVRQLMTSEPESVTICSLLISVLSPRLSFNVNDFFPCVRAPDSNTKHKHTSHPSLQCVKSASGINGEAIFSRRHSHNDLLCLFSGNSSSSDKIVLGDIRSHASVHKSQTRSCAHMVYIS